MRTQSRRDEVSRQWLVVSGGDDKRQATHHERRRGATPHIKVFDPCGRGTWYACEFSAEEGLFFGYAVSPLGPDCDEWGYFSKLQLERVLTRFRLPLERDVWWKPGPIPDLQPRTAEVAR